MSTETAKLIATHRNGAEVFHGETGYCKIADLMEEFSFPKGLFPVSGLVKESGFNRTTGFFWVLLKNKKEHRFKKSDQSVTYYGPEITGFIQKGHILKLSGVKAKEFLLTAAIRDVLIEDSSPDMIKFTTSILGLSKSRPSSNFQIEDGEK